MSYEYMNLKEEELVIKSMNCWIKRKNGTSERTSNFKTEPGYEIP